MRVSLESIDKLIRKSLENHGALPSVAKSVTAQLTAAERDGARSHGLYRLPAFCESLRTKEVCAEAVPHVQQVAPAALRVHGGNGFIQPVYDGPIFMKFIKLVQSQGVGLLGITNTRGVSGALWYPAELLAEKGLAAWVCCNSPPFMSPVPVSGPPSRVFGTNPMSFAWPRLGKPPLVFDQASSACARGELLLAALAGATIEEGIAVDKSGMPTTDPDAALQGAQLPFGGYKGSNLALMVEVLSAVLTGSDLALDVGAAADADKPMDRGHLVFAVNPKVFGACDQEAQIERLLSALPRLPSARRHATRISVQKTGFLEVDDKAYRQAITLAGESSDGDIDF
eukprot:gnl/MRDRNA2_/MRDRNA2_185115_c0_seq1.p1 gnl/MRDRNA2_/MRDRNA2_185115_c0~~gnl/MRDRNA2_/MRDRNA2_185115_c0_seq1.p1  ORF type:complete len:341 (+),score=63.59 gnl/MRDRNA2_/MRDRNA2_185115_c0_seq1:116-1138(+)